MQNNFYNTFDFYIDKIEDVERVLVEIEQQMHATLGNDFDQVVFANVESTLTSESDLQILSNTLESNPHLLGAGGMLIGEGNVLHRNCYTAVDVDKDVMGWVAGYHNVTQPTKYSRRCMVCDRIAKPILTWKINWTVLLRAELEKKYTIVDDWSTSTSLWVTSLSATQRFASCPHFVAINNAFTTGKCGWAVGGGCEFRNYLFYGNFLFVEQ